MHSDGYLPVHLRKTQLLLIACFSLVVATTPATAQDGSNSDVRQAAFTRAGSRVPQTVTFAKQGPRVGDQIEQQISIELRMATSYRQGDKIVDKNETTMRNNQRRITTTVEVCDGRTQAVLVRYPEATKQIIIGAGASEPGASSSAAEAAPAPQPVLDKAYQVRREPGDEGKLIVTDGEGVLPPIEEFVIVAQNMDMVGRSNPLADFIGGRTVKVGETLSLPKEVADRLFGIGQHFGEVSRFDLTLTEVRTDNGRECAVFRATVEAAASKSAQMRMQLEGVLEIEAETCRAVQTRLAGPIAMTESRGTYSMAYQLISTGKLLIAVDAAYRDADR